LKAFIIMSLLLSLACSAWSQPGRVILFRHAEKPADESNVHLSDAGRWRARMIADWLTRSPSITNAGLPAVLFAARPTRRGHGQRTHETLEPLAARLQLPIHTPNGSEDYALLAQHILNSPECRGKTVVICWTHEFLPQLAAAFGVKPTPPAWKGTVYNRAWVIRFNKGKPSMQTLSQPAINGH
jgi:hypothetical protein